MSSEALSFDTGLDPRRLEPGRAVPVDTPWGVTMALVRLGQDLLAFQAFCPHMEGPLFAGSIAGGVVTCPWHLWSFCLRTGKRVDQGETAGAESARLLTCAVEISSSGTLVLKGPPRAPDSTVDSRV
jgi:nitrite reductase/ring-hydroxylating ferredoxin subunit